MWLCTCVCVGFVVFVYLFKFFCCFIKNSSMLITSVFCGIVYQYGMSLNMQIFFFGSS